MKHTNNHNHIRVSTLALCALFLFLTVLADSRTLCIAGQAKALGISPANTCLADLDALTNNAKDIYEHAKSNKWKHVANKLNAIRKTEQSYAFATNENNSALLQKLLEATADLEQTVTQQRRLDTMIYANRITMIGAKMAAPLNPRIPTNVAIIAYSARKLDILSETHHVDKMSEVVYKIHLAWQSLIPQVIEHGGSKEIKKFAEIMKRLETAKTPEEYGRLASSVLDEVNILEQLFPK